MTNKRKWKRVRNGYRRNVENNRLGNHNRIDSWDFNPYDYDPFDARSIHPLVLFTPTLFGRFNSIIMAKIAAKAKMRGENHESN